MRWIGLLAVPFAVLGTQTQAQQAGDVYDKGSQVRIGQYSTQASTPLDSVSDPLAVFVQLNFPRQGVSTIDQAIQYTLMRTGWRLDMSSLHPDAAQFLSLPLPESQRSIGTFRVRDVLAALLGSTWHWHEDPVRRRLWFTLTDAVEPHALVGMSSDAHDVTAQTHPVTAQPAPEWTPLDASGAAARNQTTDARELP